MNWLKLTISLLGLSLSISSSLANDLDYDFIPLADNLVSGEDYVPREIDYFITFETFSSSFYQEKFEVPRRLTSKGAARVKASCLANILPCETFPQFAGQCSKENPPAYYALSAWTAQQTCGVSSGNCDCLQIWRKGDSTQNIAVNVAGYRRTQERKLGCATDEFPNEVNIDGEKNCLSSGLNPDNLCPVTNPYYFEDIGQCASSECPIYDTLTIEPTSTAICVKGKSFNPQTICKYKKQTWRDNSGQTVTLYATDFESGICQPGPDEQLPLIDLSQGDELPPEGDNNCTTFSSDERYQYCKEDPAEKCAEPGKPYSCESGCGYFNNQFLCVKNNPNFEPGTANGQSGDNGPDQEVPPNGDSNGDGQPDELGQLQKIANNTNSLESRVNKSNQLLEAIANNTARPGGGPGNSEDIVAAIERLRKDVQAQTENVDIDSKNFENKMDEEVQKYQDEFGKIQDGEDYKTGMENAKNQIENTIERFIPTGDGCQPITMNFKSNSGDKTASFNHCEFAPYVSGFLQWAFNLAFIIYCLFTITRRLLPNDAKD